MASDEKHGLYRAKSAGKTWQFMMDLSLKPFGRVWREAEQNACWERRAKKGYNQATRCLLGYPRSYFQPLNNYRHEDYVGSWRQKSMRIRAP